MLVQRVTIYANYRKSSINVVINGGVKRREPVAKARGKVSSCCQATEKV